MTVGSPKVHTSLLQRTNRGLCPVRKAYWSPVHMSTSCPVSSVQATTAISVSPVLVKIVHPDHPRAHSNALQKFTSFFSKRKIITLIIWRENSSLIIRLVNLLLVLYNDLEGFTMRKNLLLIQQAGKSPSNIVKEIMLLTIIERENPLNIH